MAHLEGTPEVTPLVKRAQLEHVIRAAADRATLLERLVETPLEERAAARILALIEADFGRAASGER